MFFQTTAMTHHPTRRPTLQRVLSTEPIPPGSLNRYYLIRAQQKKKRNAWQYSGHQVRLGGRYSGPPALKNQQRSYTLPGPYLSGDHNLDSAHSYRYHGEPEVDAGHGNCIRKGASGKTVPMIPLSGVSSWTGDHLTRVSLSGRCLKSGPTSLQN
eukprot:856892-Amphidinium_carterae.1